MAVNGVNPLDVLEVSAITFAMAFLSALTIKLVINEERLARYYSEIKKWESLRMKALEQKDIKLYRKTEKERKKIEQLRMKVEKEQLKTYGVTIPIWIAGINLLSYLYGAKQIIYMPLFNTYLTPYQWYFILSLWTYPVAFRLLLKRVSLMLQVRKRIR